jgi:hypothetical protein
VREKDVRRVRSDIEDLAFPIRSSRESGEAGRRGCIEHDFAKGSETGQAREQTTELHRQGLNARSFAAAEKSDEGMALKIRTKAEDIPDG